MIIRIFTQKMTKFHLFWMETFLWKISKLEFFGNRIRHIEGRSALTMFKNHRKSLIQHCERSELRLHLSGPKFIKNAKMFNLASFKHDKLAVKQCYQTGQ